MKNPFKPTKSATNNSFFAQNRQKIQIKEVLLRINFETDITYSKVDKYVELNYHFHGS